ncbi:hypothetical protein WAI453_007209 [Rhynchosporium graminicola]|uniref:Uncharacterized protein n=1 Tax=Rhynchosporium graminicola TaxID=2792576 RepID=A0A1E1LD94_9HELO|nr:uncharacterized protein RCO7_08182 [Rhynchosporium commune]
MAEAAVGLAASVVAIVAAADTAKKICGFLIDLAKQLPVASDEIKDLASDLEIFYIAVHASLDNLQRYAKIPSFKQSPILKVLLERGGFELLQQKSRRTKRRIQKAWKVAKFIQIDTSFFKNTLTGLNWLYRKPELMALRFDLGFYQANISFILDSIDRDMKCDALAELEKHQGTVPEIMVTNLLVEIERLQSQIEVHVRTIALSQEREERQRIKQSKSSVQSDERLPRSESLQDILIDHGTSATKRKQAPRSDDLTPASLSSAKSSTCRRSYVSTTSTSTVPSTAPTQSESSISQQYFSENTPPVNPTALLPEPLQLRTEQSRSSFENRDGAPSLQPASKHPQLRHRQQRISGLTAQRDPAPPSSSNTVRDFTSVKPASNYLQRFNGSETMGGISGYIIANGVSVPTTANLDPRFPQNLISLGYAASLGLIVKPHENADDLGLQEVVIEFPEGEVRSSGEVTFEWSAGHSLHKPPFNVRCLVYEHGVRNLVLGQPFLERKKRYWNGGKDEEG